MNIERVITVFNKSGDTTIVKEINADKLSIELIKNIYTPLPDDPMVYRPYKIDEKQYIVLVKHIPELEEYPRHLFDCYLEAQTTE